MHFYTEQKIPTSGIYLFKYHSMRIWTSRSPVFMVLISWWSTPVRGQLYWIVSRDLFVDSSQIYTRRQVYYASLLRFNDILEILSIIIGNDEIVHNCCLIEQKCLN